VRVLFSGYLDIAQIRSVTDVSAQHVVKQAEVRTALEQRNTVVYVWRSQPAGVGPEFESRSGTLRDSLMIKNRELLLRTIVQSPLWIHTQ
jgi:hypothetical protein